MNEMMTLLPEIYKSGIYKKYASSIFEYASKFGGIPKSTVEKRLRLERHLHDKPALKAAIGDVGVNKVSMIATLANAETDEMFADADCGSIGTEADPYVASGADCRTGS